MLSAKGFLAATRSYLRLRLLLPLILIGLLLPSAAPAQITEPCTAATGNAGSVANAGVAVPNGIQGTNGNFGKVNVGASSATPVAIVFTFDQTVTLGSTAVVTQGAKNLDFTDAGGGTCTAGKTYNASDTCTVKVTFKPRAPGPRYGGVELFDSSGNLLANSYVQGTGVGPLATFANSTSGDYLPSKQVILGNGFSAPAGVVVDASGNVFVTGFADSTVKEIVAVNGSIPASPTIRTLGSGFWGPNGVAVDGSGNVFEGDRITASVKEIMAAGGYTTVKTLYQDASWNGQVFGVAVDGVGNVFFADPRSNNAVKEIVAAGGYKTVKKVGSGFDGPQGLAVDGDGNVFVSDNSDSVKEILAAGGYTTVKALGGGLSDSTSVALDASGNLFVTQWASGTVKEIVAAGGYTTVKTLGSGFVHFQTLTVDGRNGNVLVADYDHNRVVELDYADPPSLTFAKTSVGVESSDSPQTVTVSNNGNADLTFPVPASGHNPSISSGSTLDVLTTCPELSASSTADTLAAGASCDYAVDFIPVIPVAGAYSGSLTLTDNSLNASPAVTQAIPLTGTVNGPHLAFTTPPPASLPVGQGPGTVAVGVEDSSSKVVTTSSATVTLTVTGPNSYSKVYTATASSGIAKFSSLASLTTAGSYTYTATDIPDGLVQAVATESVWAPHLAFTTPPGELDVGHAPGTVVVSVEDANNHVITTSSATVTLTVTNSGYSKVYTATASSGIATFSSLASLTSAGSYTYTATDGPDWMTPAVAYESVLPWFLVITTPPPAWLALGQAPGTVVVSVEEAFDGLATDSSATITLTVTGPNSYSKAYTATASKGIATFSSLPPLSTVGGYTYAATDVPDGFLEDYGNVETVLVPPSAVSVSPSSGLGTTQQFSFVASSPNGAGNPAAVNIMFNTIGSRVNGCYLTYVTAGNQLSLLSDDGSTPNSGQPGATGTLSNSQCSVNLSATTVTASGDTLTIAPTLTFKSGFKAGIQIYMYVQDFHGINSGWKTMGWWMVGSLPESAPSAVSVSPSSGFGTTQRFSFVASSPNGAGNLALVNMVFNTIGSPVNGCDLTYLAAGNQLSLLSDDHNTSTSGQPGTTGTLNNSQCSVNLSATTVTASGNTLTVAPTITFKSGFKAGIQIYMYVQDIIGMTSGWKTMGWWMVGSLPESAPSAVSVSPSSGFGTTQQFTFVASSPNGAGNLAEVRMLFNTTLYRGNSCYLTYLAAYNEFSLLSDAGNSWTWGQPGATGTLSNSQCSVDMSATTVTASGNTLTIAPTITFTSAFKPGLQIYMYAADVPGMNSGWKKMSP